MVYPALKRRRFTPPCSGNTPTHPPSPPPTGCCTQSRVGPVDHPSGDAPRDSSKQFAVGARFSARRSEGTRTPSRSRAEDLEGETGTACRPKGGWTVCCSPDRFDSARFSREASEDVARVSFTLFSFIPPPDGAPRLSSHPSTRGAVVPATDLGAHFPSDRSTCAARPPPHPLDGGDRLSGC